ncbi:MAG TPA: TolC family protein [Holophagaceae bacterium]|nr:TolC family protein [Holophagaceae bacterium]
MLRITPSEDDGVLILRLEGKLSGPWVEAAAQSWSELRSAQPGRAIRADLSNLVFVDDAGRALLRRMHAEGCELLASTCYLDPIVKGITGQSGFVRPRLLSALTLGALLAAASAAQAAEPMKLSLKEALRIALQQSPQVQLSELDQAKAQEDARAARGGILPSLSASAQGTRTKQNLDAFLGIPSPGGPNVVGPFNAGSLGLNAEVPLLDLSLWHRWKAAQADAAAAQAQAMNIREQVTALVVGQYFAAQRAEAAVKAAAFRVELATALEQLSEDQQKAGVSTGLDTLRAKVQLQTERQRRIQAETQLKTAGYALVRLLSLDPGTELEVTDELAAPAMPELDFQTAYRQGLAARPELAAVKAEVVSAEQQRAAAQSLRLPTIVATGSYATNGLQGQPWVPVYQIGIGVKVPLFVGGKISAQVAKAKLQEQMAAEREKALEAQVGQEVHTAQAQLEATQHEVDVANEAVALAQEEVAQARHRFEAGVSSNIEVVQAQAALAEANDRQIDALYRLNQARADLARATGRLEPLYAN